MSIREAGVAVRFFNHPMLHGLKSAEEKRQVFVDKPHVEIVVAGQDKQKFVGPVNEQVKARFPEEYAEFLKGNEVAKTGTPIEQWPQITPSQVLMMKNINIYSVEDVATLSDEGVGNLGPGGYKLRDDARKFLVQAMTTADLARMDRVTEELAAAREREKDKDARLEALEAKLAALEDKPKRKAKEVVE